MTPRQTVMHFATLARDKNTKVLADPVGFMLSSVMAGAYVGIGILLIFTLGQAADPAWRGLVMGTSFGIALTLVLFAGSELFTGHAMYGAHGTLVGSVNALAVLRLWVATWSGNLAGSLLLALIFLAGGGGAIASSGDTSLLHSIAVKKASDGAMALIARGALCNWLVCLAIWTSARTTNDAAKCILVFWCLFAFIACGFEHSVANMTIFSVALLAQNGHEISLQGAGWNLLWVTVGNLLSGVLALGWGYWRIAGKPRQADSIDASASAQRSADENGA